MIKNASEIKIMQTGGRYLGNILKVLLQQVKPGVITENLDILAGDLIEKTGGKPSFKTVAGYRYATCMCVNDEVVHGIPDDLLKEDDILCIDTGLLYKGFHTDTAWTIYVKGSNDQRIKNQKEIEIEKFLKTGEKALFNAINQAKAGNRIGHISKAIQETIEAGGYSVVKALVGHGIGKKLHEEPQIPGFLDKDINKTPLLKPGMALAIEVIYNQGQNDVVYKNNDGWTIVTKDGRLSAVFEHTIIITNCHPVIITRASELTGRRN